MFLKLVFLKKKKTCILFNPFSTNVLFLYPLKTSENLRFSGGIEVEHWLKIFQQGMLVCRNIYRNNDNINVS